MTTLKIICYAITAAFLLVLANGPAFAGDLSGTISFKKKPPLVALAYLPVQDKNVNTAVIDQKNKQFKTKMAVVKSGGTVVFKNSDEVEHNVFANDKKLSAKFDVGLMQPGGEKNIQIDWQENSIVRVGCKIHPKMRTYLAAVDTSYYQVLEFNKKEKTYDFQIADIPNDASTFKFSIPKYDEVTIDISKGSSWTVDITKKGKVRGQLTISKG